MLHNFHDVAEVVEAGEASPGWRVRGQTPQKSFLCDEGMLGGETSIFWIFTPIPWGNDPIWRAYFSDGWFNHQVGNGALVLIEQWKKGPGLLGFRGWKTIQLCGDYFRNHYQDPIKQPA